MSKKDIKERIEKDLKRNVFKEEWEQMLPVILGCGIVLLLFIIAVIMIAFYITMNKPL